MCKKHKNNKKMGKKMAKIKNKNRINYKILFFNSNLTFLNFLVFIFKKFYKFYNQ
jgi:ATP-dependent Clp protease adapter protein ClpS